MSGSTIARAAAAGEPRNDWRWAERLAALQRALEAELDTDMLPADRLRPPRTATEVSMAIAAEAAALHRLGAARRAAELIAATDPDLPPRLRLIIAHLIEALGAAETLLKGRAAC